MVAYFTLSLVFGILFTHADYSWYLAPIMSALVYAGSVQFIALSMMSEHAPLLGIILASFFVALRNSFYGLSLIERFKPASKLKKFFLAFGLVDATYAIFMIKPTQKNDIKFCLYTNFFPYISWVLGSFIGAYFADSIPEIKGMDFILTSFFMVIVIEFYLVNKKIDALFVPVLAAFFAYWLMPQYYMLIAIFISTLYLYLNIRLSS